MTRGTKNFKAVLALTRAGVPIDDAHKIVSELPYRTKILKETTNDGTLQATIFDTAAGTFTTIVGGLIV